MGTSVRDRSRSYTRSAVKFEPPSLPFAEEAESGCPSRQRPQHRLCPPPLGLLPTDRGLSVVLAELSNRAREIWPIVQIFSIYGPIVLILLPLEKTRTGKQAEAGPNRLVRR